MNAKQAIKLWLLVGLSLGLLLILSMIVLKPTDDPDPAQQRSGVLLGQTAKAPNDFRQYLPSNAKTVVFFRRQGQQPLFASQGSLAAIERLSKIVVIDGTRQAQPLVGKAYTELEDNGRYFADAFKLDTPRDGHYPIGYVIVDRWGYIRYRTLDPDYSSSIDEIRILLKATP